MDIDMSLVDSSDDFALPWPNLADELGLGIEPMQGLQGFEDPLPEDPLNAMDLEVRNSADGDQSMHHIITDGKGAAASTMPAEQRAIRGCRFRYSPEVWEAHKDEIRHLYIEKNLALPKVMQIMAERGLAGTTKMFKARFTEWGFSKNNRRRDVDSMLKMKSQRDARGKQTVFTRHGRPVRVSIERYLRRARPSVSSTAPEPDGDLPQYLRMSSPSPPPPRHILPPEDLHFEETFLSHIRYLTSQHYASWNYWNSLAKKDVGYMKSHQRRTTDVIFGGTRLTLNGDEARGMRLVRIGFNSLPQIFDSHTFYSFIDLLMMIGGISDEHIVAEIWRFLAAHSACVLLGAHPLNAVLQQLHQLHRTKDPPLARAQLKRLTVRLVDCCWDWVHSHDPIFVQIVSHGAMRWKLWQDEAETKTLLLNEISAARQIARATFGPRSKSYLDVVKGQHAVTRQLTGQDSEALFELSTEILEELEQVGVTDDHLTARCKKYMASYQRRKWLQSGTPASLDPRHELARHYLEVYVDYYSFELVFEASITMNLLRELTKLRHWQQEAGLTVEAQRTAKRLAVVSSLISQLPVPEITI